MNTISTLEPRTSSSSPTSLIHPKAAQPLAEQLFACPDTEHKSSSPYLYCTLVGIIFCIPTFILCGFEHSIADAYYFTVASMRGAFDPMRVVFVLVAVLGNTLGGWVLPVLARLAKGKEQVS